MKRTGCPITGADHGNPDAEGMLFLITCSIAREATYVHTYTRSAGTQHKLLSCTPLHEPHSNPNENASDAAPHTREHSKPIGLGKLRMRESIQLKMHREGAGSSAYAGVLKRTSQARLIYVAHNVVNRNLCAGSATHVPPET